MCLIYRITTSCLMIHKEGRGNKESRSERSSEPCKYCCTREVIIILILALAAPSMDKNNNFMGLAIISAREREL